MPNSSQGSAVMWNGAFIGNLRTFRVTPGTATFFESTNVNSTVYGYGENARTLRQYDCTAIDPGGVDVTVYDCPPYNVAAIGNKAMLSIGFAGGSIAAYAYLEQFDVSGAVGEMISGTARFRFA